MSLFKIKKSSLIAFSLLTLLSLAVSHADAMTNLIIFGDSTSDNGNVPENPHAIQQATANTAPLPLEPTLKSLSTNFYVPVSNPVNLTGYSVDLSSLFKGAINYPFPTQILTHSDLPNQPSIQGKTRIYRSMVWGDFLLEDSLYSTDAANSARLIPWSQLESNPNINADGTYTSVDYAFSGAETKDQCNFNIAGYTDSHTCINLSPAAAASEVVKARNLYLQHPTLQNKANVLIPGVGMQETLFLNDVNTGRVKVNNDTIYTLWEGGNDMLDDLLQLEANKKNPLKIAEITHDMMFGVADRAKKTMVTLAEQPFVKHILVLTLPNPALTPGMYNLSATEKTILTKAADLYNTELKIDAADVHFWHSHVQITVIPVDKWFTEMANNDAPYGHLFPKQNLGHACELSQGNSYRNTTASVYNCQGYLFWNSIHPAMPVEQLLGYQIMTTIGSHADTQSASY